MYKYINILKKKAKFIIPILIVFFSYAVLVPYFFKGYSTCLLKELVGIPCPGCGMTRAYLSLLRLDFKKAFYFHPLFWTIPFIVIMIVFQEISFWNRLYKNKWIWIILIILFITVYIIRMIIYFPNEPMDRGPGIIFKFGLVNF